MEENNPSFEQELKQQSKGQLRVVWGATLESDISAKPTLKYKQIWTGMVGLDESNSILALPKYGEIELGRLRWIVEYNQPPEIAEKHGRCDQSVLDDDGSRLFKPLTREGLWNFFCAIETADGRFRDLDNEVLTEVLASWNYHLTRTPSQKMADIIADQNKVKRNERESQSNFWQSKKAEEAVEQARESKRYEREGMIEAERRSNTVTFS